MNTNKLALFFILSIFAFQVNAQEWALQQCIDSALVNNKKIQMSLNSEEMALQKNKEVSSNLIPKISLNGDYKYYFDLPTQLMPLSAFGGPEGQFNAVQFGVEHNINANLQLNVPIYSPEIYGGINATKIGINAAKIQTEKTKEELILDISNTYYSAQIIKNQILFVDSNLINIEVLVSHVQLFQSQQLATQNDVDRVSLQQQQLLLMKHSLVNKYKQVIMGLNLLIGLPIDHSFDVEENVVKINSSDYSIQKPLSLRLLDAKYTMTASEIKTLNRTRFLPSAFVYGSYGTMGYGYDRKPNDFLDFYTMGFAGLKVTYPLFNGTTTIRKINQKKLELENYDLQKELLNDQTNLQIENAKMQKSIAEESLLSNERQVEIANSIYQSTLLQHKQGTVKLTDVLIANNTLRETQQAYLLAIVDYLKAELLLKQITGNIQ